MSISLTVRKPWFPTVLLNVCEFPPQRPSLPSLLTGFGVPWPSAFPLLKVPNIPFNNGCLVRYKMLFI